MPAIGAAIGAIATTVGAAFAAGGFFTTLIGRLLLSVAVSLLQAALMPKPREPGIKTKVTQTGGTNPCAFPLLKYATAGTHVCPPMTHGTAGKTPNAYLTYVVLLSDVPGCTLSRMMVNNRYVTLGGSPHADYGTPLTGDFDSDHAWVKFYDGSQTVADPGLMAKYSTYPERPWVSDMIGRGCAYAICTFKYDRGSFPGLPRVRFELNGIPLYDPRKDTTVGGSGAHRWANKATWEQTVNPMVAIYNVMRGIGLTDGSIWGGNFPAADIPLASAFAGLNECDVLVSDGASGTEPQFRAGLEVSVDEEPSDIIAELLKACSGQVAEIGGTWKFRVGPPGVAALALTDADIIISADQNFRPFPNFAGSYNGAHATYPNPEGSWEPKEALPYYNATFEAEDQGQRLIADLNLVSVPYPAQVRRLMYAWVEEERRFRRHEMTLPPDYALLEPLDAISWTSAANGYTAKVFEVSGLTEDLMSGHQRLVLRERDSDDFSYPSLPAPAAISNAPVIPVAQTVPSFAVGGTSVPDASGTARRPALELTWEPDLSDVTAIMWEVRVQATAVAAASGSTQNVAGGSLLVSQGILATTAYEVRVKPVVDRPADWTSWTAATTPDTLITGPDIAVGAVSDQVQTIVLGPIAKPALAINTIVATLDIGAIGNGEGWERRIHFEARANAASWEIVLENRGAQLGGGFGGWVVQSTYSIDNGLYGVAWTVFGSSGNIAQPYDDIEYRLRVSVGPGAGVADALRNVYITAVRITK